MSIIRRRLNAAFNNSRGDGVTSKTRNVVDAQLLHEMLTMLFHGFDTNPEFGGDLFVGFTFGNQLKHSFFAGSQARVLFAFAERLCEGCSDSVREDIWRSMG